MDFIPVAKPLLPTHEDIGKYIKQVDSNRFYTNFGPMEQQLKKRLAEIINTKPESILTTSSGMLGLDIAIKAFGISAGKKCVVPAWTFIATPQAAMINNLNPFFIDTDRDLWAITPDMVRTSIKGQEDQIGCVIPVAPFGMPLDIKAWEDFTLATKIPVIIDGAAMGIDDVIVSDHVVTMVSLHATKLLPAGEGGLLICNNEDFINRAKQVSCFGLHPDGIALPATNAKLSEYHAAIGLATLDQWQDIRSDFDRIHNRYHKNFADCPHITTRPMPGKIKSNSVFVIEMDNRPTEQNLKDKNIGVRFWWRFGCHQEKLFTQSEKTDLTNTEQIINRYLGIPCFRGITDEQIDYVSEALINFATA